MKVSYQWLKEMVPVNQSPEELAAVLTLAGLEVEDIETKGAAFSFENVVVGFVEQVQKHPDADRLRICSVSVGEDAPLTIVCGAANVAEGQKVAVAKIGAVLNPLGSTEPLKIKKGKIRGQESQGMICAEDELGLSENHDGIMVLPEDTLVGTPLEKVLSKDLDTVLEVAITPNRVDAASHLGVARDIAALNKTQICRPEIADIQSLSFPNPIQIEIANPERCKRYSGIYIQNVSVTESPDWLKARLTAIGLRPINNIVDITNYVLHELGQPLHAFDADLLKGNKIVVKTLAENANFITLDEKSREILADTDLMICDAENPLCIAGVFGGLASGVTEKTKNIFLESAYFDAFSVRKTAKRLGISTDSSFRFERGTDPNNVVNAALRAVKLITEIAGGQASQVTDIQLADFPDMEIEMSLSRTQTLIGKAISAETIQEILEALEISTTLEGDKMLLKVPPYRVDVQRPQDVIEEILRIYGYNNVELPEQMHFAPRFGKRQDSWKFRQQVCDKLSAGGFYEIWNNSLTSYKYASENAVKLLNPLSEELGAMRETLLWGGLETIRYNQNRQNENLALYEFGKIYSKKGEAYKEQEILSLWITGAKHEMHWEAKLPTSSLFTLGKEVEKLAIMLNLQGEISECEHPEMEYALQFTVNKKVLFHYGRVKQELQDLADVKGEVFYLVADWASLVKAYFSTEIEYKEISVYPGIRRDLSMLLDEKVAFAEIRKAVKQVNPQLIKSVDLHDVYRGKNIEEGKKSYLISWFMQDETRTLEDSVAEKTSEKIRKTLEARFEAQMRM